MPVAVGITVGWFPALTLGRSASAGNSTSEAFEMPLEYNKAPASARGAEPVEVNRSTVAVAVERYLAERGVTVQPAAPPAKAAVGPSVVADAINGYLAARAGTVQPAAPPAKPAVASSAAADVVHRYLAARAVTVQPAAPPAKPAVAPNVTADVVDRYLAARAVTVQPAAPPAKPAVAPTVTADVVDRYLAARAVTVQPAAAGQTSRSSQRRRGRGGPLPGCARRYGSSRRATGPAGGHGLCNSQRSGGGGGTIPARPHLWTRERVWLTDQREHVRVPHCAAGTPGCAGRRAASTGPAGSSAGGSCAKPTCGRPPGEPEDYHRAQDDVTPSARDLASPSDILVLAG